MILFHPHDQHLLGIRWNDSYYVDRMLPFGLCSAPKIFFAVADGFQWILLQKSITHLLHYLDDFILVAASMDQARIQKFTLISNFHCLEVPLEPSKLEGPATCLTFFSIQVNTETLSLHLSEENQLNKNYLTVSSTSCGGICLPKIGMALPCFGTALLCILNSIFFWSFRLLGLWSLLGLSMLPA